jgi:hypothetical protein
MPNKTAIDAVLNLLHENSYLPSEVLDKLLAEGLLESDIKEAVAHLLHDQQLELSSELRLHAVEPVA